MNEKAGAEGYQSYPLTISDPYVPVRRSFIRHVMPLLTGAAVKVYYYMLDVTYERRAVEGQRQWVFTTAPISERTIAEDMQLSRATASRAIADLLEMNLIVLVSQGTRTDAAVYRVRLDVEIRVYADGRTEVLPLEDEGEGGSESDPPGAQGGSKCDPLNDEGGSISDPPRTSQVDQKVIHSIKAEKEKKKVRGADALTPAPARPVVIHAAADRTPGGMGYRPPPDAPIPVDYRTAAPTPELLARQHPAVAAYWAAVGRHPGRENVEYVIRRLGDAPDEAVLARVAEEWRVTGFREANIRGILDWYDACRLDPNWRPGPANGRAGNKTPAAPEIKVVGGLY